MGLLAPHRRVRFFCCSGTRLRRGGFVVSGQARSSRTCHACSSRRRPTGYRCDPSQASLTGYCRQQARFGGHFVSWRYSISRCACRLRPTTRINQLHRRHLELLGVPRLRNPLHPSSPVSPYFALPSVSENRREAQPVRQISVGLIYTSYSGLLLKIRKQLNLNTFS